MRQSTRRPLRWAAGMLALAVVAAAAAGAWVQVELNRPYAAWSGPHVDVELPPGMSAGAMVNRLAAAGVLRRPVLVRRWLAWRGRAESLHAGEYRFAHPASPRDVVSRLERGDVLLHAVTVPEGLVLEETAERFVDAGFGPLEPLLDAFRDPTPIRDWDSDAVDLEGYLFPDTYRFPRGHAAADISATLVRRFREAVGPDYAARARQQGLTLRQAVTLASMIERETSVGSERGRISRVFHNRLQRGMKMQCDPTVLYAIRRAGRSVERLTYADLAFDSPWNTYVSHGLPPGPIASPGVASLEAAVAPDAGADLYFVAAPEGGHRFSKTLEAHLQAVAVWRAYLRSSR